MSAGYRVRTESRGTAVTVAPDDALTRCLLRLTRDGEPDREVLDALPDAYVRTTPDGRVLGLNRAAEELFGVPADDRPARVDALVTETDAARIRAALHAADDRVRSPGPVRLVGGAGAADRVRVLRRGDGTVHWLLRSLLLDPAGPDQGLVAQLPERVPGVTYVAVPSRLWRPVMVSDSVRERFGIDPDAVLDDAEVWLRAIHPADRDRVVESRMACVHEGVPYDCEYRLVIDGETRWVRDLANLVEVRGDELVFGMLVDVTRQHRARDLLEELYDGAQRRLDQMRHLGEARELLVRLFAHDVRSPLTAVTASLSMLERQGGIPSEPRSAELLETVLRTVADVRELAESLLDEDRLLHGRPLRFADVDLMAVVSEAVNDVDDLADRIVVDAAPVVAEVDALLVRRAVINLIRNALHHSRSDAPVVVRVVPLDDGVAIAVEDQGEGIPEQARDAVLDPLARWTAADAGGGGMGLAIVRQIAVLHGGSVTIADRDGPGVSIRLALPRRSGDALRPGAA